MCITRTLPQLSGLQGPIYLGLLRSRCVDGNSPGVTHKPSAPEMPGHTAGLLPAQSHFHQQRQKPFSAVDSALEAANRLSVSSDRAPCSPKSFFTGDAPFFARIENRGRMHLKVCRQLFQASIRVRRNCLVQGLTFYGSSGLWPWFAC